MTFSVTWTNIFNLVFYISSKHTSVGNRETSLEGEALVSKFQEEKLPHFLHLESSHMIHLLMYTIKPYVKKKLQKHMNDLCVSKSKHTQEAPLKIEYTNTLCIKH